MMMKIKLMPTLFRISAYSYESWCCFGLINRSRGVERQLFKYPELNKKVNSFYEKKFIIC